MPYYSDYPSVPIGGGNPYYCCSYCEISDPQINGSLSGHHKHCRYRLELESMGCTDYNDVRESTKSDRDTCELCDHERNSECRCCELSGEPNPEAFTREELVQALTKEYYENTGKN